MDHKEVLERYGKYLKILEVVGNIPIDKPVHMEKLGFTRGQIMKAYRDINATNFGGTLLDFVCSVSTDFLVWMAVAAKGNQAEDVAQFIIDNLDEYRPDVVNLLRLLLKNPFYFLTKLEGDWKSAIIQLTGLWYDLNYELYEKSDS